MAGVGLAGWLGFTRAELPVNTSKPASADQPGTQELAPTVPPNDIRRDATVAAVEEVMPGVVNIATSRILEYHDFYDELRRQYFGLPPISKPRTEEQLDNLGSGVIIDEDGYILTNWHVVRSGSRVQIKLADGRVYDAEKIVATSKSDVALLKIKAKPGEKFKVVRFAADNDLLLGETVLALGNPFGLGGSVARGILSSKNRRPPTGNEPLNIADWLQTDAAINPGNSGGPLVNLRGELIGINVAVYKEGQGIGFAIPVREVATALSQFVSPEVAANKWFGAWFRGGAPGLVLRAVQPGSPAEKAGLKVGMEIAQVNGQPTRSVFSFLEMVNRPDLDELQLVIAGPAPRTVTVKLESFDDMIKQRTGLVLQELTSTDALRIGLRDGQGLLIRSIERGSPAAQAELKAGMVVTGFDVTAVNDLRDFGFALVNKAPHDLTAKLTIIALKSLGGPYVQQVQAKVDVNLLKP